MAKGKKELVVTVSLTAQPGSELVKTLQDAGKIKSPFAGLMVKNAAFRGSVDAHFPEAVHNAFAKLIEDAAQKGLGDITDPAKRKQAQELIDALMPTARAGQLDAFFGMAGPENHHYTFLAAVKVAEGDKLGTRRSRPGRRRGEENACRAAEKNPARHGHGWIGEDSQV